MVTVVLVGLFIRIERLVVIWVDMIRVVGELAVVIVLGDMVGGKDRWINSKGVISYKIWVEGKG